MQGCIDKLGKDVQSLFATLRRSVVFLGIVESKLAQRMCLNGVGISIGENHIVILSGMVKYCKFIITESHEISNVESELWEVRLLRKLT